MQAIALKILFRKKSTTSAIIAVALLIALLTSVNALVNNINSQTALITKLANKGNTYLITSENSTSLSDSKIPTNIINYLNNTDIKNAVAQQITQATLKTTTGNYTVTIKGIDNLQTFLRNNGASINGTISKENQANIGIILAKLALVNKNDFLNLTIDAKPTTLKATGITQTNQQTDTQITMPLSTLQAILQDNTHISYIEFTIKDPNKANTIIDNLTQTLPTNTKITGTQQIATFAQDINNQTTVFINIWSIAIYIVVAAAAYLIVARAVNESQYDLYILRTLGAKKTSTINLIMTYTLTLAFLGSLIGISLGIVGTQTVATFIRWQYGNTLLAPFLEINQSLSIIAFTFAAAFIGSVYPATKSTQTLLQETHR